ncbi:hypothetical protein LWI29_032514 [Acer saccharum]|uniref:Protein NRT1/ PTR FAMILY 1.2-like n=1 Tax=Acer saccharum TaxID=4024 RepID=A0AA39RHH4_ACESA|nr:hypothetical protein LWI29_032514 [Acer saccharum]
MERDSEPLLSNRCPKGGLKTLPFIIANEAFERVASFGLSPNMIFYLKTRYNMETTTATNLILFWNAATSMLPVVGAIVADSYVGRYPMIGFGSIASLLGMILLWLTTLFPESTKPTTYQFMLLYASFGFMTIGAGGIRASSMAFGADQVINTGDNNLKKSGQLQSYFGWFLNKACIIRNPEQDLTPDGKATNPWSLCTIDQVEELKALIKVIPIWSTGIIFFINVSQGTLGALQAKTMDRHITRNFEIPAGSLGLFLILTLTLWIALYDRVIIPVASKIRGKPSHLSTKLRMGIGILFTSLSMASWAIVESIRRQRAINEGFSDEPEAVVDISAMWLLPHLVMDGLAEAFYGVAVNEFFYTELPKTMSSIAVNLMGVGMSVANMAASAILSAVDCVSRIGGKESWVSNNINKGHYDYYFWFLAGLFMVNFIYYLGCSKFYGPCKCKVNNVFNGGNSSREGD